jgi:hypothetical protein
MPRPTMLTPREAEFVLEIAREEERKAWDRARPGPDPNREHVTHALALRLALGQSPEEAHCCLYAARPKDVDADSTHHK